MTNDSRQATDSLSPHRKGLGRFGVSTSRALWAVTLAGTPFYLIGALLTGASLSLFDGARRRFWYLLGLAKPLAAGPEAWSGILARIIGTADSALRPFVRRHADRMVISLPRAWAFAIDAATPSTGARHLLERLAAALEAGAWRIDVIGYDDGPHSDASVGDRAEPASLRLSLRRAKAALEALRDAGCRQTIVALGARLTNEPAKTNAAITVEGEPTGIEIVIRKAQHETKFAA